MIFFLPLLWGNFLYLKHSDEYMPLRSLSAYQQQREKGFCLYGSAVHDDDFHYKIEGYRQVHPDIVALGSSQVLQLRERFFLGKFYNMGGAMRSLAMGEHLVRTILAEYRPRVILFGIDFWWFHDSQPVALPPPPFTREHVRLGTLFLPTTWLFQGKITLRDYLRTVLFHRLDEQYCVFGVQGVAVRSGYGPDGSHYSTDIITGRNTSTTDRVEVQHRIERGEKKFEYGTSIPPELWQKFTDILSLLRHADIQVVLFLPPLHPETVRALHTQGGKYAYVDDLRQKLAMLGVPFFDFTDPAILSASACEFIDGFHGGDVVAARLLLALSKKTDLSAIVAREVITQTIEKNAGLALAKDPRITREPEVDFQGLGCRKW